MFPCVSIRRPPLKDGHFCVPRRVAVLRGFTVGALPYDKYQIEYNIFMTMIIDYILHQTIL